jgi:hypothetical protein
MANDLSDELKQQLYGQVSDDPFLALFTLTHPNFTAPFRFVNNADDITSNGLDFISYPVKVVLPPDDNESARQVKIQFDNVSLDLITELRKITTPITCKVEMVLASNPDFVQYSLEDLKLKNIQYNASNISATLVMDDFLGVELTSEKYNPSNFPGIF